MADLAASVQRVLREYDEGRTPSRDDERAAVRATLDELVTRAPGRSVEVRIPPYAAVQAVEGRVHRRGTPSAVVETDARTWLMLAAGALTFTEAVSEGKVSASGERCDLSPYLPLDDSPTIR